MKTHNSNLEMADFWVYSSDFFLRILSLHLADAFIQSDFQYIQVIHLYCQYVCFLGIEPTTFCAANAMLHHWATGTLAFLNE